MSHSVEQLREENAGLRTVIKRRDRRIKDLQEELYDALEDARVNMDLQGEGIIVRDDVLHRIAALEALNANPRLADLRSIVPGFQRKDHAALTAERLRAIPDLPPARLAAMSGLRVETVRRFLRTPDRAARRTVYRMWVVSRLDLWERIAAQHGGQDARIASHG